MDWLDIFDVMVGCVFNFYFKNIVFFLSFFYFDDVEFIWVKLYDFLENGIFYKIEFCFVYFDGMICWIMVRGMV